MKYGLKWTLEEQVYKRGKGKMKNEKGNFPCRYTLKFFNFWLRQELEQIRM